MKKLTATILVLLLVLSLAGCNRTNSDLPSANNPQPADLTGTWTQINSESDDSYQTLEIDGNNITVYWVSDDTKALYWAGTYEAPTTPDEPYSWNSVNDKEKTNAALLASGDDTKTFTYKNGQLFYEVTAMGVTTTVIAEKD